ncbi:MAG TPA: cysteine desulfurase family protein [Thermoguttaceae bacterium]|nr:cysteine desulfurase family protein [Thermoguttaceae bacterium]
MDILYLDHNATTPMRPEVVAAMRDVAAAGHANPASQHRPGQQARWVLDHARMRIIELLGGDPHGPDGDRLVFTSGGTEANNLAVLGIAQADGEASDDAKGDSPVFAEQKLGQSPAQSRSPGHVLISPVEHASVVGPAERLLDLGWSVDSLPVGLDGVIDAARLSGLLRPDTRLATVMLANHETGVVQPVGELAEICRDAGVPLHTDAVQAVGKMPVDFRGLGVDAMSASAHKFHGPVGIGALLLRAHVALQPQILGGHQQEGLRGGTESLPLAVGMMTALELAVTELDEAAARMTAMRDRFETTLKSALPGIVIHGQSASRLPQTSNAAFPGLDAQVLFMALDTAGVACSIGAACDSGAAEVSPTLRAMGIPKDLLGSSLRFSFAATTSEAELAEAARRIIDTVQRLV